MTTTMLIDKYFPKQKPESDYGNKEYKRKIMMSNKFEKRVTQLLYRIYEGNGKAIYIIGLEDNGVPFGVSELEIKESIKLLSIMSGKINATIKSIRYYKGSNVSGVIATVKIIKQFSE
jgi:GTPase